MKKIIATAVAAFLATATAANAMDWTGFYFGAEAGQNWNATFHHVTGTSTAAETWSIGLVGGHMWDVGDFLLGVEAEFGGYDDGIGTPPATVISFHRTRLFGSLSARAAIPFDRFLPYVSGGLRATSHDQAVTFKTPLLDGTIQGFGISPVAAVGLEVAVTDAVSVKAEYTAIFGSIRLEQDNGALSDFHPHSAINVGMNFRF